MMVKPVCPKCGSDLGKRGEVFWCKNCIGWIAPNAIKFKMRHKSCGHWNFKDSHLCEGCGQRLDDDYVVVAEQGRIRILSIKEEEKNGRREEEREENKRKIEEDKRRREEERTLLIKREIEEKKKRGGEVQSSDLSKQLRGVNLKFKRVIKREKGEVTPPLPPPQPHDRGKYKSQFRCKACGRSFWVSEHRLKVPYCLNCGAPDPIHIVIVEQ